MAVALGYTYFLDIAIWEKYGLVNDNIDPKKLRPIIYAVQRTRIEPIVGTPLYDKLVTEIDNGTLTGLYETLMKEHIIPTMVVYCDWKATFHLTSQMTNKTTGKNNDEHIRSNTTGDNNNLRDELIKDAKQYENKMIGWLCDNKDNIPELCEVDEDKLHQSLRPSKKQNDYLGNIGVV